MMHWLTELRPRDAERQMTLPGRNLFIKQNWMFIFHDWLFEWNVISASSLASWWLLMNIKTSGTGTGLETFDEHFLAPNL